MKFLENIFDKLDEDVLSTTGKIDLDFFRGKQNPGFIDAEKWKTGRRLTHKMVLNSALMFKELDEITNLMVRDSNIYIFDDNLDDEDDKGRRLKLKDL